MNELTLVERLDRLERAARAMADHLREFPDGSAIEHELDTLDDALKAVYDAYLPHDAA